MPKNHVNFQYLFISSEFFIDPSKNLSIFINLYSFVYFENITWVVDAPLRRARAYDEGLRDRKYYVMLN